MSWALHPPPNPSSDWQWILNLYILWQLLNQWPYTVNSSSKLFKSTPRMKQTRKPLPDLCLWMLSLQEDQEALRSCYFYVTLKELPICSSIPARTLAKWNSTLSLQYKGMFFKPEKPCAPWVFSELFNNAGIASRYCSLLLAMMINALKTTTDKVAVCQRGKKWTANLVCTVGEDSNCSASIAVKI